MCVLFTTSECDHAPMLCRLIWGFLFCLFSIRDKYHSTSPIDVCLIYLFVILIRFIGMIQLITLFVLDIYNHRCQQGREIVHGGYINAKWWGNVRLTITMQCLIPITAIREQDIKIERRKEWRNGMKEVMKEKIKWGSNDGMNTWSNDWRKSWRQNGCRVEQRK